MRHTHWFAVHSTTGVNIGLWQDGAIAVKVQAEHAGRTITELVELTPEVSAAPEMAEELDTALIWLRAALDCKEWSWDADQRAAAEQTYASGRAVLAKATGADQ